MSNTASTEQVRITEEHVGRLWVERYTYDTVLTARGLRNVKPTEVVRLHLIDSVEPADVWYYKTCPDAGPRVKVGLRRILSTGEPSPKSHPRWLPTTGNESTTEIEVAK